MMNQLFQLFSQDIAGVALLSIASFGAAMLLTPAYTTLAYRYKWWKRPRRDAITGEKAVIFDRLHHEKHNRHIPTMAGVIVVLAVALVTLVLNYSTQQTLLPLMALIGGGAVGLLDDIINLTAKGGLTGLRSQVKFLLIFIVAALGGIYMASKLGYDSIYVPFLSDTVVIGSFAVFAIFTFIVVATANAVNMTDGLDGLAGGLLISAFTAYTLIAVLQGNIGIAGFCATMVGALMAYTWFNIFPARFFMGDVGSFAMGASLGVVAMLTDTVFLLPVIAGVFVLEAGSSLLQILSKKIFGKKIFSIAPIHHHFESAGWPETKVTMRFWILGQVSAIVGVVLAILGGIK